jgi:hypothetical protein
MEREIHAKLHAAIGDATPPALRFAPGPVPSPGGETRAAVPPVSPTPAEMSEADVVSAAIDDPGLRDAVRRTVAAGLARGRADRGV